MLFSGLKDLLRTFDEHGWKGSFKREFWTIGNGGYDCWFELYYKGIPVARCIDGVLEGNFNYVDAAEEEKLFSKVREVFPHLEFSSVKKSLNDQICHAETKGSADVPKAQGRAGFFL